MLSAITLDTGGDTVKLLIIAAIAGAFASLVAELLLARGKAAATGAFEIPGRVGGRFYDLGSIAAIPAGILAAGIAGLALTPVQEVTEAGTTTRTMELDNLLVVASTAGLASSAFLKVLADRFVSAMKTQGLDVTLRNAISALKDLEENPAGGADEGAVGTTGEAVSSGVAVRAREARESAERELRRLTGEGVTS